MPKVLHVIARINRGGTARYLENLVPGLEELGWQVLVATGNVQHGEEEDEIVSRLPVKKIRYLGRKIAPIQDLLARRHIKKTIREFQPDIIHSHTFKAGLLTRTIKTDIPRIHTYHGHLLFDSEFTGLKLRLIILSERLLSHLTKRFITTGEHVAEDLLENGIGSADKYISVMPSIKKIELIDSKMARNTLGIETQLPIVVWLGRLVSVKAPETIIEIAKLTPEFYFAVFGDGELMTKLSDSTLNNLKFLGWQDSALAWSIADLALITSKNEGISNTLLEAMSINIPIVASDIMANVKILGAYPNKSFVIESPIQYSEALKTLHENRSSFIYSTVTSHFSHHIDAIYREYI
jgi:glycosyltransferase involved in cell wall biosynthesis